MIQTFLLSISIGLINKTFWFSYVLFIIFIGGILIIFIYITTLSSNEKFLISIKFINLFILIIIIIIIYFLIFDLNYINFILNYEINLFENLNIFLNEDSLNLNKLYSYPTNFSTIFIIIYLFLTLIVIVKITNLFYGPLRTS